VAVCATDAPVAISGFQFDVVYDDHNVVAPEIACDPDGGTNCRDDNPDANTGSTTFGVSVPGPGLGGTNWDCSIFGTVEPEGDSDATDSTTNGRATIKCLEITGAGTMTSGPLAVIDFDVLGTGVETLALENTQLLDGSAGEIGSCSPVLTTEMGCFGAEINKGGGPIVTPAPTETAEAAGTPTATPSATGPVPTATPIPAGMETVELYGGCQFEAWTGVDGTKPEELVDLVGPAGNLRSFWAQQPPPTWRGFSPQAVEVSDLLPVNLLDVLAICTWGPGVFVRPVV
jgi:hypothetical protein